MTNEDVISRAVKGLNDGQADNYETLVQELKKTTLDTPSTYLDSLRRSVKHINKKHETLIGAVLNIDWTSYDEDTSRMFIEFLAELISVRTFYVKVCVRSLVKQLAPKGELLDENLLVAFKRRCEHVHTAVQTILHIAPLSSRFIVDAVKQSFPYLGKKLFVLETFVVHLLQLATYAYDVRFELLQLLIDKIISIDVLTHSRKLEQATIEIEGLTRSESEQENINKLDQLMAILFSYIDSISFIDGVLDYEGSRSLFKDFLGVHEHFIMKTQCTHVQFLLFYMASYHKDFTELFISMCWRILQDPNYAGVLRETSASYLSSFLARAKFVDTPLIRRELQNLSTWIHRYIDYQDDNAQLVRSKHSSFYSACQALFYVFLYHHKILLETPTDIKFIKSLNFVRVVTSRLNPLKHCLESVVAMFARVTRMYQIVFCYSIIERNNRSLDQMTEDKGGCADAAYLGNFFPFDPYMLGKSGKWIEPLYCSWKMRVDT
jgi:RNA polymerase I-specific transcription initiation factor RRN3